MHTLKNNWFIELAHSKPVGNLRLWIERTIVILGGFFIIERASMVVDDTLLAIVMLVIASFVGWLISRIEGAHRKISTEQESRFEDYKEIAKQLSERMNRTEINNMMDQRVNPINANILEIKEDLKTLVNQKRNSK